jgi:hypothetical protein
MARPIPRADLKSQESRWACRRSGSSHLNVGLTGLLNPYLKPADYLAPLTGAETGAAAGGPNGAPATLSGRMIRAHPRISCPP